MTGTARRPTRRSQTGGRRRLCASEKRCTGNFGARTGLRFYNSNTGRWSNRDPILERGGVALFGFVGNEPIRSIDVWGLYREIGPTYHHGVANSGGLIGASTGRGGVTVGLLRIASVRTSVSNRGFCSLCCIDSIALEQPIDVYLPVVGDSLPDEGSTRTATATHVTNVRMHEQGHVFHIQRISGALGPKIETDCGGKCWTRRAAWTRGECQAHALQKLRPLVRNVNQLNGRANQAWHYIVPSRLNYQITATDMGQLSHHVRVVLRSESRQTYCSDGFRP